MEYHVAKNGNDKNNGSIASPFLTIQKAADTAIAGDCVIVHCGTYREWVKPANGGISESQRIIYRAAENEKVVIKGSEILDNWTNVQGTVWKAEVPNTLFGSFNPFAEIIGGDWLVTPLDKPLHLGMVYMNGNAFYEAQSLDEVITAGKEKESRGVLCGTTQPVPAPEDTIYRWYAEANDEYTVIYANFQGYAPCKECIEINVRKSCFAPDKTGINYITVHGFELCHAATPWAPPTSDQAGIINPHWSKGWIIENNDIHDARCSAVCLGKEYSTGDNNFTKWHKKPGYQYQMEAVFMAYRSGWDKEHIGSHIVRDNKIYNCGQNGITGHMGCIFSEIYNNEIFNIAVRHEFWGHEIAGIKLHAAIDVYIHNNYIHNCALGTWLDWQAQGTRASSNIYNNNERDFMIEVTHGPCLVDNNIFTAEYTFDNAAQGTAFVHNYCGGFTNCFSVLNRSTPYHLPHSTQILGTALVYGSDDRLYQNIFKGGNKKERSYGTARYNGAAVSMEEYIERVKQLGEGDVELFEQVKQPAYINGNVYFAGARAFEREEDNYITDENLYMQIDEEKDGIYLSVTLPEEFFKLETREINSENLGITRITEQRFENPDGSDIHILYDMLGNARGTNPVPGPLEELKPGKNHICIWKK